MAKTRKPGRPAAVRIIAGRARGRRIPVESDSIRPTPDRVRETVFNWLQADLQDTSCLDMFAGTGALGIEAWSRGAGYITFVEQDRQAAKQLGIRLEEFGITGELRKADALQLHYGNLGPFDIVFLDPPFQGPDLANLCTLLESSGGLSASALIYMEMHRKTPLPELPAGWTVKKEQTAGQVRFALAESGE
ncbi:MAG: 16S rRNA (guanine(966)-N(2))-methyltransferase RsmD [Chromatiales bacterium]|nr:16S rRNA (guanine(966)-N(2))-methyltransferase RsmD [Chromatiales bacterium]MDP6150634.1 16S rRNA (guanine(966)-N(2))-methyltransferase RsmD [Gammaproteobacteria bacterium]MDP7093424.1 16S rRNA (guanine(966)-N(2))-methyltransferase RsmD [Gammaproteobacteria bacterium]HJP05155.1 16S rRNA (guanine(966)-N(2))-methyltransferase RsmD [Gammaproteobacteria bacterium]